MRPSAYCRVGLHAEEGLWTFDNFPAEKVRQAYGFAPDAAWLDHVRLASVRLPGCSAGIVSRHGLVLTNHHCVLDCIQDLSAPGQDLNMTPVLAATAADERQCPGLEAEIVVAITDVTAELVKATEGLSGEAFQKARDAEIARIDRAMRGGRRARLLRGRFALFRRQIRAAQIPHL